MYEVFSDGELNVILDWIESLRPNPSPCIDPVDESSPAGWPEKMADLILSYSSAGQSVHQGIMLPDESGQPTPLVSLLDRPPLVMAALVRGGWIVPGSPDRSMFFTRILTNGGPMDGVMTSDEIDTVSEWIRDGAKLPTTPRGLKALRRREKASLGLIRPLIGMGSVH